MSIFIFKQKTAYELRISDWSSDVCSSDLAPPGLESARRCNLSERRLPPADGRWPPDRWPPAIGSGDSAFLLNARHHRRANGQRNCRSCHPPQNRCASCANHGDNDAAHAQLHAARQRVGEGNGMSVRVIPGGRLFIKKNKKQKKVIKL